MKKNLLPGIFLACIVCFIFSCDEFDSGKKKFEFYYYPAKNVYYDVANAQFAYSIDGGQTWELFKKQISKEPATLGIKQIIYSESPQPWDSNSVHRKLYNGNLLMIADVDTSAIQNDVAQERKIVKKTKTEQPKKEAEKKPGFFKRLFGKKHQ